MKVTYHATQRFLERVLHKVKATREEFLDAHSTLEEIFGSVVPGSYARSFVLPGFKGYTVVHQDNTVITIIEKKNKHSNKRKK